MLPAKLLLPASLCHEFQLCWLAQADLEHAGSYDTPIKGCDYVIHTASPVIMRPPKGKARAVLSYLSVHDTGSPLQSCSAQTLSERGLPCHFMIAEDTVIES